jgi:hypothetical protein
MRAGVVGGRSMGMLTDIPFGERTIQAELPNRTFRVVPMEGATKLKPIDDLESAVKRALTNPLGSPPIGELVKPGARVIVAFDDLTVPSFGPIRTVAIREVLCQLQAAGVARETVTLICANSLHRKFRPKELAVVLGDDLVREFGPRLLCHDAEDRENLVSIGQTPRGYDVEVSRYVAESDLTVYINCAHFRGFSGGWKSICVGLSTFRSIRHHHTPDGMSMSIRNNRMHEMLDEMGKLLEAKINGKIFKIDTIEADPFHSAHVFAGSPWETRKAALDVLVKHFPARRDLSRERYDVVLYGVPAWSPYAIFSSMNPILTLISSGLGYLGGTIQALGKPGCTVIMATPCPEEWDRVHHPSYPKVWENVLSQTRNPYEIERIYTEEYATNEELIELYRNHYAFHPIHGILATHPLRRLKHCGKVIVAGIEDPAVARHLGFEATRTVEEALSLAADIHGRDYTIAYAQHPPGPTKITM